MRRKPIFNGILIDKNDTGYHAVLAEIDDNSLPQGDVTVAIEFSSLNYKDALAITGKSSVVRNFPMVPGIDLAGTVTSSTYPDLRVGMQVLLNGWGVGERHWGGLAQKARLQGEWLIPLPSMLKSQQAMAIGTAGYTAMLCVMALEQHGLEPDNGEVLVTGATGGVGGFAIAILAGLGYHVVAMTGRTEETEYLQYLGASEIMPREQYSRPGKPLDRERWAGVVDVVGTHVLANACAATRYGGIVTACGLAGGMDFPATVAPFILRAVTLVGIDSVMCPREKRLEAWQRLGRELDISRLDVLGQEIGLAEVLAAAKKLLAGQIRGRVVVDVNR